MEKNLIKMKPSQLDYDLYKQIKKKDLKKISLKYLTLLFIISFSLTSLLFISKNQPSITGKVISDSNIIKKCSTLNSIFSNDLVCGITDNNYLQIKNTKMNGAKLKINKITLDSCIVETDVILSPYRIKNINIENCKTDLQTNIQIDYTNLDTGMNHLISGIII